MTTDRFETARKKYIPKSVKYLLVAETPPKLYSERFFYFERVLNHDSLFIEIIKCIYPNETIKLCTKEIRSQKIYFLKKFQNDGYYLIDSLLEPFENSPSSLQKIKLLQMGQKNLLSRIDNLVNEDTKIILICATVYRANFDFLKSNAVNVINKEFIDFPGSGCQKKFREKFMKLIKN